MRRGLSIPERFWSKVKSRPAAPELCWIWGAAIQDNGYGVFYPRKSVRRYAHRMAWIMSGSELPTGMEIDHACRNRACVRPGHLSLVGNGDSARQGMERELARRAASRGCRRGHEWRPETTKWQRHIDGTPWRTCRICDRINRSARKAEMALGRKK